MVNIEQQVIKSDSDKKLFHERTKALALKILLRQTLMSFTIMKMSSLARGSTARNAALSLPVSTLRDTSVCKPGSLTGLMPLFTASTMSGCMSKATTRKPASANRAAVGKPT